MKKLGIFLVAILVMMSCSNTSSNSLEDNESDSVDVAEKMPIEEGFIKNVTPEEFKDLVENGSGITLDVRTPEETAQGHIADASIINLYDEDFVNKINLMQKDKEIYVYCKSGGRSSQAAKLLSENGFTEIYNLDGGTMAWENAGYPLTEPTEVNDNNINVVSVEDFQAMIASEQPVLVDFHTLWCAPCKKMAPIIDEIETEYEGKAIVMRIDADASKELAKHYQVQGVPEFFLFVNGEQVWQHNGLIEKDALIDQLDKAL